MNGGRLDSLTRARFGAALAVVLFHDGAVFFGWTGTSLGDYFGAGFLGVSFFFTLSGFVLMWSARRADTAPSFWWRRFARIWPLYAALWLVTALGITYRDGSINLVSAVLGLGLMQAWHPDYAQAYNFPAWSLSVEAFFYALFPLLALLVRRFTVRQALVGSAIGVGWLACAVVVGHQLVHPPTLGWIVVDFPVTRLGEFFAGMCIAAALSQGWRPRWSIWVPIVWLALVVVAYAEGWYGANSFANGDALTVYAAPAWVLLIAAIAAHDLRTPPASMSESRLTLLGNASYALYISHAVIVLAWALLDLPTGRAWLAVYALVCVAVSVALFRLIERPAEAWLRQRDPFTRDRRPAADGRV